MTITIEKLFLEPSNFVGNSNQEPIQPVDYAAWIWAPDPQDLSFCTFLCEFDSDGSDLTLHVTGDQRWELYIDDELVGRGPDRCPVRHWSFASYRISLPKGKHTARAFVWHTGEQAPMAMETYAPGFVLKADDTYDAPLTTGSAPWRVKEHKGVSLLDHELEGCQIAYFGTLNTDLGTWFDDTDYVEPVTVRSPIRANPHGLMEKSWSCFPSTLPDMYCKHINPGVVRHAQSGLLGRSDVISPNHHDDALAETWQSCLVNQDSVTIPANQEVSVIWDLDNYFCAFLHFTVSGGKGADFQWQWAESLFTEPGARIKGQRDEVNNKIYHGLGPGYQPDGETRHVASHWWYAGRFCLLTVKTGDAPLTLSNVSIEETHYPFKDEGSFSCDDANFKGIHQLGERVMQMCMHTTYMDCPYYEQLMYVGDTRLEVLTTYSFTPDDRLPRRAMELYDYSRDKTGFINERFPSRLAQFSPTFSLIWTWMINDYNMWRDDLPWVRERAIGVRASLDVVAPYINQDHLVERLPGWPFCDWVPGWKNGNAPQATSGISCLVNMHYWRALQCAAAIHDAIGETEMAARYTRLAEQSADAIRKTFWCEDKGLLADTPEHDAFSEHVQCLAIIGELYPQEQLASMFDIITGSNKPKGTAECTVYYKYYLFEAAYLVGRDDIFFEQFNFWHELKAQGFKTTVESPEPSRSDCHAWGAHPLHHWHTSIAGIRPVGPGFNKVSIEPMLGPLKEVEGKLPHPKGWIEYRFTADGKEDVTLPAGVERV